VTGETQVVIGTKIQDGFAIDDDFGPLGTFDDAFCFIEPGCFDFFHFSGNALYQFVVHLADFRANIRRPVIPCFPAKSWLKKADSTVFNPETIFPTSAVTKPGSKQYLFVFFIPAIKTRYRRKKEAEICRLVK
jgi:hypothetical protein